MPTVIDAVLNLRPGADWVMNGDDVEGITWHTPNVEPLTRAEVDAEIKRLEAVAAAEVAAREAARLSAMSKLAKLGLTEDEVEAMLGAWPLVQKIEQQAQAQLPDEDASVTD